MVAAVPAIVQPAPGGGPDALVRRADSRVREWRIEYVAHDGRVRWALVVLPAWYGPRRHPSIPLVISPHGRGVPPRTNAYYWGDLPAAGRFALVAPEGQGRRLRLLSWGCPGEVEDLARMPTLVEDALPWLRIDWHRIYAFGGSMGGQETLLLLARHRRLLAGAAAFDAPTDLALRYRDFSRLRGGARLQALARREIGGTPTADPRAYAARSPIDYVYRIAFSGVPLQIWWSTRDRVVADGARESGLLYREVKRLNPLAPVVEHVGTWAHTHEMRWNTQLPEALEAFGLLPQEENRRAP